MIRFSCDSCKANYEVDDSLANRAVDCGNCHRPRTVPDAPMPTPSNPGGGFWLDEEERTARRNYNRPRPSPAPDDGQAPDGSVPSWVWYVVIIIVINIFLIPLTGSALVPR